jgi:flagellar hook-associated protein 1 FlgK
MSDLMTIGASGVRAYQAALSTTSDNIANAATPGYSRRSATIAEVGRSTSIALGQTTKLTGNGSIVTGIARAGDVFRAAEVRTTGSDLAKTETGIVWLDRVETSLTDNKLAERLTAFFNAAKGVAADPAATTPRAVLLETAGSLATAFTATGRALTAAATDVAASGADAARSLTDLANSLDKVNTGLAHAQPNSIGQAQLLDERDRLLEGVSALIDADVSLDAYGRASVRGGGAGGPVLVDPDGPALMQFASNTDGTVSLTAYRGGVTEAIPPHGGALAGIADGAAKIAAARKSLDGIASSFMDTVNQTQANGRDLDGQPGLEMFVRGTSDTELTVNPLLTPRGVAAALDGEGVRGNGNLTALAGLRQSIGFEAKLDDLTTTNAAALAARRDVANAQGAIRDAAVAARDGVSGVDLDEEAVNLIRFQQAYQASSRVIQVARDVLQTIIDIR